MNKIVVEKYNKNWKKEFDKAKVFFKQLITDVEINIEHVGSTAVEGLYAKPILDIDIVVENSDDCLKVIKLLSSVGYIHIGNLGVEGREAFKYEEDNSHIKWMKHHLYVCIKDCENLKNHLLLRNHLRNNKDAVEAYSLLKCQLADKYPTDIDSYIDGKTDLITGFLKAEGMNTNELEQIEAINKI